jgi:hypothetical protein
MSSNTLDRSLVLDAVRVTEAAAIASWTMLGRGDEMAADQAARRIDRQAPAHGNRAILNRLPGLARLGQA